MPRNSSSSIPHAVLIRSVSSKSQPNKLRFPLPDNYFPPVSLSLSQVQEYHAQVEEMVTSVIESCRDHESRVAGFSLEDERSWQDVAHDSDLSIVRRREGSITVTRTVGTVEVGFRQFVDFFSSKTSEQLFAWNQFFLGCAVDAAVLCNLDLEKSDKQATLGIKWTCMQPSKLMRKRDECFLEYVVFRKDDQGRDAAVIVRLPVEIPECPPLPNELKTKRELITTVTLVRASDSNPNASQVFMLSQCENKGLTASTKYCKKLLQALKNVALSADAKRIATAIYTPGFADQSRVGGDLFTMGDSIRPWVPSTSVQQNCTSCSRPFRNGHRRRHCQMCGDVYCSKCLVRRAGIRQQKNAFSNSVAMTSQRTFRVAPSLFCKVCVSHSRDENAEAVQEQIEANRRSLASSKSSSVPRHSSMGSSTQPASSTPVSSSTRGSQSQQTDAPRWWSENESDTCSWKSDSGRYSSMSRNYSVAPTARSSFSSDYSLGRNSFLAVQSLEIPRETGVDRIDDRIDERSSIYEVIDTKDMVPEKQLRNQPSELNDLAEDDIFCDTVRARYTSTPVAKMTVPPRVKITRRTRSTDVAEKVTSSRSLHQCIAEQNELLQQVLSASRGINPEVQTHSTASSVTGSNCEDDDVDSHDDGGFDL